MKQKTLVLIKPDAIQRRLVGEIISRFEKAGFKFADIKVVNVSRSLAEKHYHLDDENYLRSIGQKSIDAGDKINDLLEQGKKIMTAMCDFLTHKPVIAIILEGPEVIALIRQMIGYTDPSKAPKGTIRGDWGEDSILEANSEGRPVHNLVHASGNPEEAETEIALWFGNTLSSRT